MLIGRICFFVLFQDGSIFARKFVPLFNSLNIYTNLYWPGNNKFFYLQHHLYQKNAMVRICERFSGYFSIRWISIWIHFGLKTMRNFACKIICIKKRPHIFKPSFISCKIIFADSYFFARRSRDLCKRLRVRSPAAPTTNSQSEITWAHDVRRSGGLFFSRRWAGLTWCAKRPGFSQSGYQTRPFLFLSFQSSSTIWDQM